MTAVAPGSVAPDRIDEDYRTDEDYLLAVADALREENAGRLPSVGGTACYGAKPSASGHTRGTKPVSRLLGQLERSSRLRRAS